MAEKTKRRLSSAWGLKASANVSDEEVEMELNDDAMEKRNRVTIDVAASSSPLRAKNPNKLAELSTKSDAARKRKSVGWGVIPDQENQIPSQKSSVVNPNAHLSNEQLADLYSNCIKLSTENKITQKNSWQLNLIDYMEDVLVGEVSGDNPNFQTASCTLDASIKIYSCRVDSVHTDTYKVLGGLTRTGDKGEGGEEGEEGDATLENVDNDGEKTGEAVEKKKKAKKLHVGGVNTLEANLDAINAKKIDLEFLIDPLFRKTSAAFDEGGAKGLLLNHLSVHHVHHGCELVFDSVDAIDVSSTAATTADQSCDISDLQDLLAAGGDLRDIADLEICPTFANFEFEKGKAAKVENVELNNEPEAMISDDNFGSEGEDFAAGGFDGGNFDFGGGSDGEDAEGPAKVDFASKLDDVEQVVPGGVDPAMVANDAWADFQHINPKLAKKWAGPEHWRFTSKPTTKADEKGEGETTKKRTKGEKKTKEFFIDFLAPPPPESAFAPPGRAATTQSATLLKKASEASTTLPVDVHYDLKMLTQLFSKPKWMIPPVSRRFRKPNPSTEGGAAEGATEDRGENEPWYEYNNANDASFVNDDGNADDDDDHFGDGFDGPLDQDATKQEEGNPDADFGTGLVAEPAKVAKISINYAKVAKKVDVKALKSTIWTDLCDAPAGSSAAKDKAPKKDNFEGERTFDSLLSSVEQRAGKEVGEVSVALCFICMLHLCNEKGLSLAQQGIEDLRISST